MHYLIGNLGHLSVVTAFVTSLVSAFAYWKATTATLQSKDAWLQNGRVAFYGHTFSVLAVVVTLFVIIQQHYFEYHYAYSHSDSHLPGYYLLSTFWNGQEGSFLLWMFWHVIIGVVLIKTQKSWEAPSMVVFALVQAFLTSMILGVVIPGINLKLGSSPFILLRDAINDPIFKLQPDFIPKDCKTIGWSSIPPPYSSGLVWHCPLLLFALRAFGRRSTWNG
jgi:cytochrome c-type biogenesis protein CcmF